MNHQFQNQISDYIFKKQKEKGILNNLCAHYATLVTESLQSTMPTNIQVQRNGGKLSRIENAAKIAQAIVLHYFRSHNLIYSLRTFGADYQNIDDDLKYLLEKKRRFRKSKNKNAKPKFDNQKVQEYLMNEIQLSKSDNFISMLIQGHDETYIKRSNVNGYRISCVLLSKKNTSESSQFNSYSTNNKRNITVEVDSDSQQHKRRRRLDSNDNYLRQSERSPPIRLTPYNYFKIHRSPDSNLDPIELTFDEEEEEESKKQEFRTRSVSKIQQSNNEYDYASSDNAHSTWPKNRDFSSQNSVHYKKKVVQKMSEEIVNVQHHEHFELEEREDQIIISQKDKQQTEIHSRSESHSDSETHSRSGSHSDSETHSRSGSHSGSSSHSRSGSHSDSETHSRSGSHSDSETHSRSGSHSGSSSHSRSGSHSDSETHSRSGSHSGSSSHSRTSSHSQTDDNDAAEHLFGNKSIADDDKSSKGSESERVIDSEQQSLSYLSMSGALSDSVYLSGPPDIESNTLYKNKSEISNSNKETNQEKSAQSHSVFDSSFDISNLNFSQPDPRFIKKDTNEKSDITIDSTIVESKSEIANDAENEDSKSEISIDIENSNDEIKHENGVEMMDLIEEEEEETNEQSIFNYENSPAPGTALTPSADTLEKKSLSEENDE